MTRSALGRYASLLAGTNTTLTFEVGTRVGRRVCSTKAHKHAGTLFTPICCRRRDAAMGAVGSSPCLLVGDVCGRKRQPEPARCAFDDDNVRVDAPEPVVEVQLRHLAVWLRRLARVAPVKRKAGLLAFRFTLQKRFSAAVFPVAQRTDTPLQRVGVTVIERPRLGEMDNTFGGIPAACGFDRLTLLE